MLSCVVRGKTAKTGTVGVDDANLIAGLHFEYLADESDSPARLTGG